MTTPQKEYPSSQANPSINVTRNTVDSAGDHGYILARLEVYLAVFGGDVPRSNTHVVRVDGKEAA
jgi:hypothetical protein